MTKDIEPKVDIDSPEFKAGVEAGLKSTAATRDWQAGLELGQKLKAEGEIKTDVRDLPDFLYKEPSLPLFLRPGSEASTPNAQDEKDEMGE